MVGVIGGHRKRDGFWVVILAGLMAWEGGLMWDAL